MPETVSEPAGKPLQVHYSMLDLADDLPFALALTGRDGKVLWANGTFSEMVAPAEEVQGQLLRGCFQGASAAALEHVFRTSSAAQRGQLGRLTLAPSGAVETHDLIAYWLAVALPDGPGYVFALSDDWGALCPPDDAAAAWQRALGRPGGAPLALLIQPGAMVEFWDERWQALTGLSTADVAGVPSEVVLDWLFPRQPDRERVTDLLNQAPVHQPAQVVLEVLHHNGSQPLPCTFLPVSYQGRGCWLLLAGTPEAPSGEASHLAVQRIRTDAATEASEPHAKPEKAPAVEPPAREPEK
jgi:hypothetical protein